MVAKKSKKIIALYSAYATWSSLLLLALGLSYSYRTKHNTIKQATKQQAQIEMKQVESEITKLQNMLKLSVEKLVNELNNNNPTEKQIKEIIKKKPIEVSGYGVAFAPKDTDIKKFSPYYVEEDGKQVMKNLADFYDYTQPEHTWYHRALTGDAHYSQSDQTNNTNAILLQYSAPVYKIDPTTKEKKAVAVVFANQSLKHLQHFLSTLYLDNTGYWFIVDNTGVILTHPSTAIIQNNISDVTHGKTHTKIENMLKAIRQKQSGLFSYQNELTGSPSWLFYTQLPASHWILCRVFDKKEIPTDANTTRRDLIHISLLVILVCTLLAIWMISRVTEDKLFLWATSCLIGAALAGSIGAIWYAARIHPTLTSPTVPIESKIGLYKILDALQKNSISHINKNIIKHATLTPDQINYFLKYRFNKEQKPIPTGIFINHISFTGGSQVEFIGYVWQRYFDSSHGKEISRGFTFPDSFTTKIKKIHESTQGNTHNIIWRVKASFKQQIINSQYPFGQKTVKIQLMHQDFDNNIILVPDIDSYNSLNPSSLPGMNPEKYLHKNNFLKSYFGYMPSILNTNFGLYNYGPYGIYDHIEKSDKPILTFNLLTQGNLFDDLISNLLPLLVTALLLFLTLVNLKEEGFDTIKIAAGMLFAVILAHFNFRSKLSVSNVVYFEHFFFVLYSALIAVTLFSLLYSFKIKIKEYTHTQYFFFAKIAYWPLLFFTCLLITLSYLY